MVIERWRDKKMKPGKSRPMAKRERLTTCVCEQAKWERKQKGKGNAESPWPPACNLQSADGEARDEEVHSVHF